MLVDGRWKAIRTGSATAPIELYDLKSDAAETNNVAATHPEVIGKVEAYLSTARTPAENWPLFAPPAADGKQK